MASVTVIEFTDLECKVLQVEKTKGGRPSVRALLAFPLPKNEDIEARVTARAQILRDLLKQAKLAPQKVRVIIPKHYVVSRKVTLPSVVDAELEGMARFEAERHIHFNADRHIIDHHVLSRNGMQGSEVLLAAVDLPVAKEYLDVCLRAGLNVETLDVSTHALHRAFSASYPAAAEGQDNKNGVAAVVNVGLAATEIVIIQNGQLAYNRSASVGLEKLLNDAGEVDPEAGLQIRRLAEIDALEPDMQGGGASPAAVAPVAPPPVSPIGLSKAEPGENVIPTATPGGGGEGGSEVDDYHHDDAGVSTGTDGPAPFPVGHPNPVAVAEAHPDPFVPDSAPQSLSASMLRLLFSSWQLKLLKEIRTTYEYARREFNCPPITHFHICGEGALIKNFDRLLANNFGVEASIFDPFRSVEVPQKVEGAVADRRPAHAALVGGALSDAPNAVSVNLLPNQYLDEKSAKRQQQSYMITGILALTALILAYVWVKGVLEGQDERLETLRVSNSKMAADVKDLKEKKKRNEIVNKYARDRKGAVEILDAISSDTQFAFIPKSVALKSFEYTKDESVKITGWAMTLKDANQMRKALESSTYFESVKENDGHNQMTNLPNRDRKTQVYQVNLEGLFPKQKKKTTASKPQAKEEEL